MKLKDLIGYKLLEINDYTEEYLNFLYEHYCKHDKKGEKK